MFELPCSWNRCLCHPSGTCRKESLWKSPTLNFPCVAWKSWQACLQLWLRSLMFTVLLFQCTISTVYHEQSKQQGCCNSCNWHVYPSRHHPRYGYQHYCRPVARLQWFACMSHGLLSLVLPCHDCFHHRSSSRSSNRQSYRYMDIDICTYMYTCMCMCTNIGSCTMRTSPIQIGVPPPETYPKPSMCIQDRPHEDFPAGHGAKPPDFAGRAEDSPSHRTELFVNLVLFVFFFLCVCVCFYVGLGGGPTVGGPITGCGLLLVLL